MIRRIAAPFLLFFAACSHQPDSQAALSPATPASQQSPDDFFLNGLVGDWTMTGAVMGEPVRYVAKGARTLAGAWIEFHMIDAAKPPQYEARVFIGADGKAGDFVAHWLDGFGAAGARVAATGERDGNRLRLEFPYADGAFRNIWTRRDDGSWTLDIDAQGASGDWSEFARYSIVRK